jgi:hypothetical protein
MKSKSVGKIIIKKSIKTYRRMIIIFLLIFLVISAYLSFYVVSISNNNKNFYNNKNAHIIDIEGKTVNNVFCKLNQNDVDEINNILNKSKEDYKLSTIYKLSSGILNSTDQNGVILYGIDENFASTISEKFIFEDDVFYSDQDIKKMKLIIPQIVFTKDGNVISDSYCEKEFDVNNIESLVDNPLLKDFYSMNTYDMPVVIMTNHTFFDILKLMLYNEDEDVNKDQSNLYDYISIEKVYVYVDHISSLNSIVTNLDDSGFYIRYAFDSFENFSKDLTLENILYHLILIVILFLSGAYIILSYKNYMKSQQKDIGILKLFGYKEEDIYRIYSFTLYRLFIIHFTLISVFNIATCIHSIQVFLTIEFVESILTIILILVIKMSVIKGIVKKNILSLLKYDKEFE